MTDFCRICYTISECCSISGQIFFLSSVRGGKEVVRMQKKAVQLLVCAVILLYIFCIKAR